MKILILGATGMLGSALVGAFARHGSHEVVATARRPMGENEIAAGPNCSLRVEPQIVNADRLTEVLKELRPDAVINCIGIIKQLDEAKDPLVAIPINAVFPHRVSHLCGLAGARLVHISTDCVFSGFKGNYRESDFADADDLYGRTKLLGEVTAAPHAVTLRTSIIGHELASSLSLVDWFLAQTGQTKGFTRAIFSGLPTVELADIIINTVLPRPDLHGLYHVSAAPIDKYSLLKLLAAAYGKQIEITPVDEPVIDRSLDSSRFRETTGYQPTDWPELVEKMHRLR